MGPPAGWLFAYGGADAEADCGMAARSMSGMDAPVTGGPPSAAYDANGNTVAASIAIFMSLITRLPKWTEHGACLVFGKLCEIS
jgi:hypothetical protein